MKFKSIQKVLKSIDIYGQRVEMNFQNEPIFKTVYGGIVTLFIGVLLLVSCWFFGQELIYKSNPSVISSQRSVVQAKRIDLVKENIIAMLGVSDGASQIWNDPTIFTVRAVQEILSISNDTSTGKVVRKLQKYERKVKICDQTDIGIPSLAHYFGRLDLSVLHCLEPGQDMYTEGDFDADRFAQVFMYVEKCKNTTSSVICKPIEVINQKLMLTKIQIFLSDNIIDPLNFNQPFTSKGMNLYSSTSSSFPKEIQIYFTNQYIEDDVGFLYKEIEQKHSFIFTDIKETNYFSDYNVLARVLFRIQKQKENLMQRRYQKFADIVALLGGLLKILTTIGTILTCPFSSLYLFKAMGDKLFNYNLLSNQDNSKETPPQSKQETNIKQCNKIPNNLNVAFQLTQTDKKSEQQSNLYLSGMESQQKKQPQCLSKSYLTSPTSLKKKDNQSENIFGNNVNYGKSKISKIIESTQQYFTTVHSKIKYTFKDYFRQIFCYKLKTNQKQRIIQKGIKQIQKQLDVVYIIHKLQEIDKLKSVILNEDQQQIFDYIPKPIITEDQSDEQKQLNFSLSKFSPQLKQQNTQNPVNYLVENVKGVYSNFKEQKEEQEQGKDAITGLQNILNQKYLSKLDFKLIELLEPVVLYQQHLANQENKKIEINQLLNDSIFSNNQLVLQHLKNKKSQNTHFFNQQIVESPQYSIRRSKSENQTQQKNIQCEVKTSQNKKERVLFSDEYMFQSHVSQQENEFVNIEFEQNNDNGQQEKGIQYDPTYQMPINTISSIKQLSPCLHFTSNKLQKKNTSNLSE